MDLHDNYIGDLAQLQYLKPITSLRELILQSKTANNPICDFENYQEVLL